MPLHRQKRSADPDHSLNDAIRRAGGDPEPGAELEDRLMVEAVHGQALTKPASKLVVDDLDLVERGRPPLCRAAAAPLPAQGAVPATRPWRR